MSEREPSKERGIYHKFNVVRTDGKSAPGQKHHDCFYFVLDCDHDPHARAALLAYAASCEADYPALASDVRAIVESGAAFGSGEDKHVSDAVTIQPAHEPRMLPEPPSSMEDILEWIRSMSDDDAIKNMVGVAIEKWTAIQARASQPPGEQKPVVRSKDELQRAHDTIAAIILRDVPFPDVGLTMRDLNLMGSVLCWCLRHDHNDQFDKHLQNIEEDLARRGYIRNRVQ